MFAMNPTVGQPPRPLLQFYSLILRTLSIVGLTTILVGQKRAIADDEARSDRHVVFLTQKGKDKANEILAEQLREETGFKCTVLMAVK